MTGDDFNYVVRRRKRHNDKVSFNGNICRVFSTIYVDNNTNMANALERCSGSRLPLASCNYAIADLHKKALFTLCISTQLLTPV